MILTKKNTLYPTLGEVLNEIGKVLGTKPPYKENETFARKLDKLAKEGDFDYSLIDEMIDKIFQVPFPLDYSDLDHTLKAYGRNLIEYYVGMMKEIPLDGFSRRESIPWLVEHHACFRFVKFIEACQVHYKVRVADLDYFENEYPLRTVWNWLERQYPQFVDFRKNYGSGDPTQKKMQLDKEWKWKNGKHIPDNETLWGKNGLLTKFYEEKNIIPFEVGLINECVFFAKILQQFLKNTSKFNTFTRLHKISRNRYIVQPEYTILKQYLPYSEKEVMDHSFPYLSAVEDLRMRLINAEVICRSEQDEIHKIILNAEDDIEEIADYRPNWWHISRFHGMWYVLFTEDIESAVLHYMDAVRGIAYSGDHVRTKKIFKEALVLCCTAYLGGTRKVNGITLLPFLSNLKNQAIVFGAYENFAMEGQKMDGGEILYWKNKYSECFRKVLEDQ